MTEYQKGFDDGWERCKLSVVTFFRLQAVQKNGIPREVFDQWADLIAEIKKP